MSDRDEATGQFAPAEPLTGIAGVEADAGYVQRPDPSASTEPAEAYGSDEASLRELALKKFGDEEDETVDRKIVYYETGEPVPENWAQTVEQAASDISNVHRWEKDVFDAEHSAKVAAEIDAKRAEKLKADPRSAEHYGIEAKADDALDGEATADEPYVAPTDGELHPEVAKALKHPQVRQAIEQELSTATQSREAYTAALENSRVHTVATLAEVVPHLIGLPPAQLEQGLATLAEVDPPAFNKAMNILGRANTIVQAQQQEHQRQTEAARQNFEAYAKSEDAKFRSMVDFTPAKSQEVGREMVAYASELGI